MGHTHVLGLAAVDTASQGPAPGRIGAVIHIAVPAKEALAAERLDIDRHPVAGSDGSNGRPDLLYDAHHLVTDRNARYGAWYAAVFYVQVAGTDASQRYTHDSIVPIFEFRFRLIQQPESSAFDIGIGLHDKL